jgi:hypothetical protein
VLGFLKRLNFLSSRSDFEAVDLKRHLQEMDRLRLTAKRIEFVTRAELELC